MARIMYEEVCKQIADLWVGEHYADAPIDDRFIEYSIADNLTTLLLLPYRQSLIEEVTELDIVDDEDECINLLISRHRYCEEDCIDMLITEFYLTMIEDYLLPFNTRLRMIDLNGFMLIGRPGEKI